MPLLPSMPGLHDSFCCGLGEVQDAAQVCGLQFGMFWIVGH